MSGRVNFTVSNPLCMYKEDKNGVRREFYTVGTVVKFLKRCYPDVSDEEEEDFQTRYAEYLQWCLQDGENIVQFRDAKLISDFLFGKRRSIGKRNKVKINSCFNFQYSHNYKF